MPPESDQPGECGLPAHEASRSLPLCVSSGDCGAGCTFSWPQDASEDSKWGTAQRPIWPLAASDVVRAPGCVLKRKELAGGRSLQTAWRVSTRAHLRSVRAQTADSCTSTKRNLRGRRTVSASRAFRRPARLPLRQVTPLAATWSPTTPRRVCRYLLERWPRGHCGPPTRAARRPPPRWSHRMQSFPACLTRAAAKNAPQRALRARRGVCSARCCKARARTRAVGARWRLAAAGSHLRARQGMQRRGTAAAQEGAAAAPT